jgi:L-asparagine transporter-like permease
MPARRYCPRCQDFVRSERGQPNNLLHFFLSLCTCVWLPVWLFLLANQLWYCDECGSRTYATKTGRIFEGLGLLFLFTVLAFLAFMVWAVNR